MTKKTVGLMAITLALVLALVVSACGPAAPAEKEKAVKIGYFASMTGPLASTMLAPAQGFIDSIKYQNEQGGIDGVKIDLLWRDCGGYEVPKGVTAHKSFVDSGAVLEVSEHSSQCEALVPMAQKDKMPLIYHSGMTKGMVTEPLRWCFGGTPGTGAEFCTFMKWVKDNWTEPRLPRIGIIGWDIVGTWECIEYAKFAPEIGVDYIGYEVVPALIIDASTELLRLRGKEPDWLYMYLAAAPAAVVVGDAMRLGFRERGIELFFMYGGLGTNLFKIVGEETMEGVYGQLFYPIVADTDRPGVRIGLEAAEKYRGWDREDVPFEYLIGWTLAVVAVEGVRLAIEQVGLDNLTGPAVRDALANMKDFDSGLIPPITMSDERPFLCPYFRILQARQGRIVAVSDYIPIPERFYPPELR